VSRPPDPTRKYMPARREPFLRWLLQQPDDANVGRPRSKCDCPVARFANRDRGLRLVPGVTYIASREEWSLYGQRRPLPRWARQVVDAADGFPREATFLSAETLRSELARRFNWPRRLPTTTRRTRPAPMTNPSNQP
jgi:hypothetical protein